jgi:glycosyltransferase involved in cell wall biosynthesis
MDNELIKASNGDFIIWCDSDDYLVPNAVERLISVWKSMPLEDQLNYIGLTALCATKEGILQSSLPSRTGIFETTWNELDEIYNVNGDMLIFFNKKIIKNSRFIEVDFMISEGSLWLNFFEMKTKFIPEVLKIMDRGVINRISFSGKMEYCRGKAYSISICEKIKPTLQGLNKKFIRKLITYHRYCIHGDIGIFDARNLWGTNTSLIFWLATYPIGLIFAVKDLVQRKVVKTHIDYDKNIKVARIQIINYD